MPHCDPSPEQALEEREIVCLSRLRRDWVIRELGIWMLVRFLPGLEVGRRGEFE